MDWPALAVKRPFCMSPDAALPLFDATQLILLNGMVALPQPPDWQESAVDESTTRVTGRATAVPSAGRVGDTETLMLGVPVTATEIGRASLGKECRSRWSPDH